MNCSLMLTPNNNKWGQWHEDEMAHINVLELKAILFALQSLCREQHTDIRIWTDNTTALAYVKKPWAVLSQKNVLEKRYKSGNGPKITKIG